MTCDVCGHEMRREPVPESRMRWEPSLRERWFCGWCYAWTDLGHHPHEVSRPQYEPMSRRWERAEGPELPEAVAHAYGHFGTTLCGIAHDGLTASPYWWMPEAPHACQACKETATVIDRRWPEEMRDGGRIHPAPPPGSQWPPF
ncbi:hypothetical protein ACWDV7_18955 [Streptomyces sp. NPDC003362]